jgi:hypothetical protein
MYEGHVCDVVSTVHMYEVRFEMLFIGNECAILAALSVLSFINTEVSQTFKMLTNNKNNLKLFL